MQEQEEGEDDDSWLRLRSHLLSTFLLLRVKIHLKQHCEYLTEEE